MRAHEWDERGQDLAEYAIIFVVLCLLLLGIIEFGIIVFTQNTLSNAAREGARFAVVRPHQTFIESTDETCLERINRIVQEVCDRALAVPRSDTILVSVGPNMPESVTVTVSYTYDPFFGLISPFLPEGLTLGSQSTMRLE